MALGFVTLAVLLIAGIRMSRASVRGEHHIAARYAAVVSLTLVAKFGYQAYRGETSALLAALVGAFVVAMFSLAIARRRFHAPPG